MSRTTTPDCVPLHDVTAAVFNSTATACSTCTGRCCYEYTVTVTGWDVWRIALKNYAPQQYLVYFPSNEENGSGFRLTPGGERHDMAIDKAGGESSPRPCVFLMELPGNAGRCGIHSFRPQVCRTYPAALNADVVTLRDDALCPTGAWKLAHMDVEKWRTEMTDFVVHRDVYEAVVTLWNERVQRADREHDIEEYFDFLLNIYARLAAPVELLGSSEGSYLASHWGELRDRGGANPLLESPQGAGKLASLLADINSVLEDFRPPTITEPAAEVAAC